MRDKLRRIASVLIEICKEIYPYIDAGRGEVCAVAAMAALLAEIMSVCGDAVAEQIHDNYTACLEDVLMRLRGG